MGKNRENKGTQETSLIKKTMLGWPVAQLHPNGYLHGLRLFSFIVIWQRPIYPNTSGFMILPVPAK